MQNQQNKPINEVIDVEKLFALLPLNLTEQLTALAPANDPIFNHRLPYQIVGVTPSYQVIQKGNPNLANRYTRRPFIITDNDMLAIELYKLKLANLLGESPKVTWSKLVYRGIKSPLDYETYEAQLVKQVTSELINLGSGEVTLSALNKLIAETANCLKWGN